MKAEPIDLLAALQASINRARGKNAPCDTCDGTGKRDDDTAGGAAEAVRLPGYGCPDGATCHHECAFGCWRVAHAGPLPGRYSGDEWPRQVREEYARG